MSGEAQRRERYAVLDAWRGICACLVVLVHVPVAHVFHDAQRFVNMQLFVDFFFVLSGFVIYHAYGQRLTTERSGVGFMIRRFGRVWPLHAAVLAGFVALELVKLAATHVMSLTLDGVPFTADRSWSALVSNLVLTQAFDLHGMTTWNGPAWSIGVEFYTYAVFAIAVLAFGPRAAVFAGLALIGLAGVVHFSQAWMFTTHDFGFWRCLYGFFAGCLVSMAIKQSRDVSGFGNFAELACVAVLLAFIWSTGHDASSLLAPLIFAIIVYVFAFECGAVSRFLLTAGPQALGLWSYSIYMIHMLVFAVLKIVFTVAAKVPQLHLSAPVTTPVKLWSFGSPTLDLILVAGELAAVIALAGLSYAWIEAPARRYFARLADAVEAAPEMAASSVAAKPGSAG